MALRQWPRKRWQIARDDRPWGNAEPPAVVHSYAAGHGTKHAIKQLARYGGIVQCDGYAAYKQLVDGRHAGGARLAFCWAHWRRCFYEIANASPAPIANEALARTAALYAIEKTIHGRSAEQRLAVRQAQSKPVVDSLKTWLEGELARVSGKSVIANAIRYGLKHWDGLVRFLEDGRIEMDTNAVERAIRPVALTHKNALFAGCDEGAANWARIAPLIETCKLNGLDPQAYFSDVLTKLVNLWPASRIDELMPWACISSFVGHVRRGIVGMPRTRRCTRPDRDGGRDTR
jgi:hypothetical protein